MKDSYQAIASTGFAQIRARNVNYSKYIYLYLVYSDEKKNLFQNTKGLQYPTVGFEVFKNLKIYLPDLATQQQIVDYCDANQKIIDSLEAKIKANKELAKTYLASVLGLQQTETNEYSASAENFTDSEVSPEIENPAKKQKQ